MQIAKWGDALAVRLPAELVESLGLKEGDEVAVSITPWRQPTAEEREAALAVIRSLARPLPEDYKFDREEANAR
jgi:antitoxin MazE